MKTLPPLDTTLDARSGAGALKQDRQDKHRSGFADVLSSVGVEPASASPSSQDEASSRTKPNLARQTTVLAPGLTFGVARSAAEAHAVSLTAAVVAALPPQTASRGSTLAGGDPSAVAEPFEAAGSSAPTSRGLAQGLAASATVPAPAAGLAALPQAEKPEATPPDDSSVLSRGAKSIDVWLRATAGTMPAAAPGQPTSSPSQPTTPASLFARPNGWSAAEQSLAAQGAWLPPRSRRDATVEETASAIAIASASVPTILPTPQMPGSPSASSATTSEFSVVEEATAVSLGAAPSVPLSGGVGHPLAEAEDSPIPACSIGGASPAIRMLQEPALEMQAAPVVAALTDIVVTSAVAPAVPLNLARGLAAREPTASLPASDDPADVAATATKKGGALARAAGASTSPSTARGVPGPSGAPAPLQATTIRSAIPRADTREPKRTVLVASPAADLPNAANMSGAVAISGADSVVPAPIKAIVASAAALAAAPSEAASAPTSAPIPAPAKTMTVRLSYGELGPIAVRMHLVGQALDIQVSAPDARTASLIGRDRDALSGALRDQQFDLRSLVIQGSDNQTSGDGHAPANNPAGDGSRPGAGSGHSAGSGGSPRDSGGSPARPDRRSVDAADPSPGAGVGARSRALYV